MDAAAGTIYEGTMVGITATGTLVKASAATAIKTVGVAMATKTYSATDLQLEYESGCFAFANSSSTAALALASGDRWEACYVAFDNQVTNDAGAIFAGFVADIDADGVWVDIDPRFSAP
jgi:hypothetical protein